MKNRLMIFGGSSHPELTGEICINLGTKPGKMKKVCFANDNIKVRIEENVRGADVYVVQTSAPPVSDNLVELLMMINALKYSSAERITAVLPYFPYVRSDKKDEPRICITAKLVADLLATAGADRILTMNLHSPQIQGFFNIPSDHILAKNVICNYFKKMDLSNCVLVAPDAGSAKRVGSYAKVLDLPMAILDKRREDDSESPVVDHIIGEVKEKRCLIFDDEISTAGSMDETIGALREQNSKEIYACCVHGVLVGKAEERLLNSGIKKLVITNTLPLNGKFDSRPGFVETLTIAPVFARAMLNIHEGESVSSLF
ncbi:ribose-phosphate diphosphokinase [Candidatus Riflebacteria bacterium]